MFLRVLSYNIHKAIGVDRRFDPARIIAILRHHEPDIVLLQEVDRGAPRSGRLDLASHIARELGSYYYAGGMNVFLKEGRYGNATLSRWPIGRQRNIQLSQTEKIRRGAQHTHIHVSARGRETDLDVFNVHLGLTGRARRRQVRRLLNSPDIVSLRPEAPCIIAGDTNDWRGLLRRGLFEPAGFRCATNHGPASRWAIRTYPSFAPTGGLDKIFYRGGLQLLHAHRSRLALARVASDHLPIIAEFRI